eukprot:CAMPEP_0176311266 /NCGR_PEP_ID=MMETSP0121_2-20121125/66050_1 /TAXON_ID=160619 /ORGANISM="Kryptoperidinium foliaceum, Strain CCMP 1326" /LENGTH=178 /DNA_ID=CAMNT_0017653283 /DNA_START=8 /DNA_END=544 /DNA_ORIENTATION=-
MTIKESKTSSHAGAGEPDIVFSTDQQADAVGEPDIVFSTDQNETEIPFAMATMLPETEAVKPAAVNPTPSGAQHPPSSNTTAYPPAGTPPTVVTQQVTGQGTPIPEGARWITVKHVGGVTWSLCALISTLTCFIVLLPCGLWALLCPCDQIRAYEVNGQVYDEHGRPLGHISKLRVYR